MTPITLETPRLLLRPMRADDVDALLGIFGDPRVMAAFDTAPFERPQMEAWLARNLAHQQQHGYGLFALVLRENGLLIGDCGLEHMQLDDGRETELGYDLRSDYWGQGLATEAARAVRDFAFQELRLPRLISLIRQGNVASRRVAEKIGLRHDADLMQHGAAYWRYAITREAWLATEQCA